MMMLQNVSALKGKNVHLPNSRENQVNGNCTRTKKLKLQYKEATKLPFRQVQFVIQTVQFILQDCFLLHFSFALFSVTLPCLNFPPSPHPPIPPPTPSSLFNTRSQGFHFESIVVGMFEFGKLFIYFDACLKLHVCMYVRKWQTLSTGSLWPCSISDV